MDSVVNDFKKAPNMYTAARLIADLSKHNPHSTTAAFEIYRSLCNQKLRPHISVYGALITACRKANQPKMTVSLWGDMKKFSVPLNSTVFHSLVATCAESLDKETVYTMAVELLDVWKKTPNITQTPISGCMQLMKVFVDCKDIVRIFECYDALCEIAFPSTAVLSFLMMACNKCGASDKVDRIVNEV